MVKETMSDEPEGGPKEKEIMMILEERGVGEGGDHKVGGDLRGE